MVMLVHLAAAADADHIERVGLSARRSRTHLRGVYAMPVLPDFYASHQWLRELKRWKRSRTIVAVHFRIPDDDPVLVGHYARRAVERTAAEAVGLIMKAEDKRGYEIVVPRSVRARDIHRVRPVPQVVGWRYWPGAHGTRPCGCPVCLDPGQPGARAIRESYED